ncbi:54S ribosomal protein L25, mitochondrial [Microsporum audouinii]
MAVQSAFGLVEGLPLRLRNFFARYPPQFYSSQAIPKSLPQQESSAGDSESSAALKPAPSPFASRNTKVKLSKTKDADSFSYTDSILRSHPNGLYPNPFLPYKNPETGRWRGAVISLRRQAELVKLGIKYGVEELLPPGRKSTEYKQARLIEKGLRVKGTGIGQKVKGHKWERAMRGKLEDRKKAMLEMPEMIRLWKQRGHGRGWKKYPRA